MRFACQSCGKAYNLPEEKIADKSNVKLKCRVCGAIVEVKRQGDVVAQILADVEGKRGRVSEAPAPLTSMSPDDEGDDATHAIAVGDQILAEGNSSPDAAAAALLGHVKSALGQQRGLVPLPPPPPTGFSANVFGSPNLSSPGYGTTGFGAPPSSPGGSAPAFGSSPPAPAFGGSASASTPAFGSSPPAFGSGGAFGSAPASAPAFGGNPAIAPFGATPVPPPLSQPEPPAFGRSEPAFGRSEPSGAPPLPGPPGGVSGYPGEGLGSPPPPLPSPGGAPPGLELPNRNGSNGMVPRFGDMLPPDEPVMPGPSGTVTGTMSALSGEFPQVTALPPQKDDTTRKMLAAFATGILIGYILAQLFS